MRNLAKTLVFISVVITSTAFAQGLPAHYPDSFPRSGTVDDVQQGAIVVGDILYRLSDELVIHTYLNQQSVSIGQLRNDVKIGFEVNDDGVIVEIWLLPVYYNEVRRRR